MGFKRQSEVHKDLRSPKYRQRVEEDKRRPRIREVTDVEAAQEINDFLKGRNGTESIQNKLRGKHF